jgi:O-antigen/teichoic acid export membrane protein
MSRIKRAVHGVASGYAILIATSLYSLASIPLALHFLSNEEFGLWGVMISIGAYLALIDLGMSSSVARLLIDHKDDPDAGIYGGLIRTGSLVLAAQGLVILVLGFFLAPLFCSLSKIEPHLQREFISLVRWQSGTLAFGFAVRIFGHILQAHQRLDLINYGQIGMTSVNFLLLWFFFEHQQKIFSLVWSNLAASLGNAIVLSLMCWKLRFFPAAGAWGKVSFQQFKEIFVYGKDIFFVALGTQLITASQIIIITRGLGLEAAAAWSVGTKSFNLICQAVWRIMAVSSLGFSEMMVRKEHGILRERFKSVVIISTSLSAFAAISFALCNSTFVRLLSAGAADGSIKWPPLNDILLGIWMVILTLVFCHNSLVLASKQIGFQRYIYFVEGSVFVFLAWFTISDGGIRAVIGCSIVSSMVFTNAYGFWRTCKYFGYSLKELTVDWMKPAAITSLFFGPVAIITWWTTLSLPGAFRFSIFVFVCITIGGMIFLRAGLPRVLRMEMMTRVPKSALPVLKFLLGT